MLLRLNNFSLKMLKITQQKRNELLHREEIFAEKEDPKTPSMDESKAELGSLLKKDPELIAVNKIKGRFGSQTFVINAYAYDNKEIMDKIEPKKKEKKDAAKPAESGEAAAAKK